MMVWTLISIIIIGILVLLAIVALYMAKIKQENFRKTGKYPEGHFFGMGMGIGMALSYILFIPLSIFSDRPATGIALAPAIGAGIGSAIGSSLEKKNKHRIRPMTEGERKIKKASMIIGVSILAVGVLAFTVIFFLR